MTLHRNRGGEVVFECDGCDDTLEPGTDDFGQARDELKAEHWQTRKDGEAWNHYCPACKTARPTWWDRD